MKPSRDSAKWVESSHHNWVLLGISKDNNNNNIRQSAQYSQVIVFICISVCVNHWCMRVATETVPSSAAAMEVPHCSVWHQSTVITGLLLPPTAITCSSPASPTWMDRKYCSHFFSLYNFEGPMQVKQRKVWCLLTLTKRRNHCNMLLCTAIFPYENWSISTHHRMLTIFIKISKTNNKNLYKKKSIITDKENGKGKEVMKQIVA